MPEQLPYIFRIPTALSWTDAQARLLARADSLRSSEALDARFFVGTQLLARLRVASPEDARRAVNAVAQLPDFPTEKDALRGGWEMRGALDIRVIPATELAPSLVEEFADHRAAGELARFLHHLHWIPQSRGITDAFVDEHYPGRTWQGLVLVLTAAGILVSRGESPPSLMPTVAMLHFTDAARWAVVWGDGVVTASLPPERPAYLR
ncbi:MULTISPECIES: hypothetical protein [unclassified Rathayibacter]|uniref:hypothetical protein n=1 Tax=unclassified Rathayibacter TaxID=2609250 RepID=UPI0011B08E1B|nr:MULTISPECIES: hypothetical protein [unclassified Rathayibacter]